jgi:hypothetical protein
MKKNNQEITIKNSSKLCPATNLEIGEWRKIFEISNKAEATKYQKNDIPNESLST